MTGDPGIRGISSVFDVADRQLCSGCGACAYVEPDAVRLVDRPDEGIRPVPASGAPTATPVALAACPGIALAHDPHPAAVLPELLEGWGPVLEVWEGHASDPEIRWGGSSGGATTAIALHCLEEEGMHGVLHVGARPDVPYLNHTVLSRSRAELVAATGSRYAPASPCDSLDLVEAAPAPCVFIGKPCDVAGARRAAAARPALAPNLGLTIALFCAGTPSTRGTLEMLREMGVADPADVRSLRYRGNGWPGAATATTGGDGGPEPRPLTYDESWNRILQRHRPWRCRICPDHTGEFADIAVGDPWYREVAEGEAGSSLIVVRSERGRRLLAAARAAGVLELRPVGSDVLPASQPHLLGVRGAVWGRTTTMRALGLPTPRYTGLPTFPHWWRELSLRAKAQSVVGTARRIVRRRLYRRLERSS